MNITIRSYAHADQPKIRALHDRTPPAGQELFFPVPWFDDLDDIPGNFDAFWVATMPTGDGEDVVGMVGAQAPDEEVPDHVLRSRTGVTRLQHMRVAPEHQRTGIGRRLTETVVQWARSKGYRIVILETTPQQLAAVALYESVGFSEIGRSTIGRYELVWFERRLS